MLILAALLCTTGCRECGSVEETSAFSAVRFSGCSEVRRGRICELQGPETLILWVETETSSGLVVLVDGAPLEVVWRSIHGGFQAKVAVEPGDRAVVLSAPEGTWRLPLETWQRPKALTEAAELRRAGEVEAAEARLAALLGEALNDPRVASEVATERSQLAAARGRYSEVIEERRRAADMAEVAGLASKPVVDRSVATFHAIFSSRDLALARKLIQGMRDDSSDFDEAAARADYYLGVLARETGDLRTALRALAGAIRAAEQLGLSRIRWSALGEYGVSLAASGQYEGALEIQHHLVEDPITGASLCSKAIVLGNLAWISFLARDAGLKAPLERGAGERSLRLFTRACPAEKQLANLRTTLALMALAQGRLKEAERHAAEAREAGDAQPHVLLWLLDTEARIAASEGKLNEALDIFSRLESLARRVRAPGAEWRALVGRAGALGTKRDVEGAIAAFRAAERKLDENSLALAIGGPRSQFVAARGLSLERHVELLIEADQQGEAVAVLRRARARLLRGLDTAYRVRALSGAARQRWEAAVGRYLADREALEALDADLWAVSKSKRSANRKAGAELERQIETALDAALEALGGPRASGMGAPPEANELILGFHRTPNRWFGFGLWVGGSRVLALTEALPERPEALARLLLGPFEPELGEARRLRLLVGGDLAAVDFHALPWKGTPLIETHVVTYAVDLPPVEEPRREGALVVADPTGNLPAARDEARAVAERLRLVGPVEVLEGDRADRGRLMALLSQVRVLHYAGHGRYAGTDGWSASLPLGGGTELTVGDILARSDAPARVVLSGCETGRTSLRPGQQIGLAQAFIAAGAREVVAAFRPVGDALAQRMAEGLYVEPGAPLGDALRQVQRRELSSKRPDPDWSAFRVLRR